MPFKDSLPWVLTALNGTFKPENWIDIGNKLETIENCAYLGKDGKIVTGSLEIVEKDGVVGVKVLEDAQKIFKNITLDDFPR